MIISPDLLFMEKYIVRYLESFNAWPRQWHIDVVPNNIKKWSGQIWIVGKPAEHIVDNCGVGGVSETEQRANARLIAASPDILYRLILSTARLETASAYITTSQSVKLNKLAITAALEGRIGSE
jgi:hypothetical protein